MHAEAIPSGYMVCTQCGSVSRPSNSLTTGQTIVACALIGFAIIPGLIYLAFVNRGPKCRACGAAGSLIPPNTPRAQALLIGTDFGELEHEIGEQGTTDDFTKIVVVLVVLLAIGAFIHWLHVSRAVLS